MAKKRLNSDQDEFKFQAELAPSLIRSHIVIDGVTISGSDWETFTGQRREAPVRFIQIPDELSHGDREAMRIGKAVRALQSLGRQYGSNIHITLDGDDIGVTNGHGELIAFAKEHDFDFDDEALMFEHVVAMASKSFEA